MARHKSDGYYKTDPKKTRYRYIKVGSGDPTARVKVTTPYAVKGTEEYWATYLPSIRNTVFTDEKSLRKALLPHIQAMLDTALAYATQAAYNELRIIYENCVMEYYSYITKSYIRHGEGSPGTGSGSNLLNADQITLSGSSVRSGMTVHIIIDSAAMGGYPNVGTDQVLDEVGTGLRFMGRGLAHSPTFTTWTVTYSDAYWSCQSTIKKTFDDIDANWDDFLSRFFPYALSQI